MSKKKHQITKASGEKQLFSKEKLYKSLIKSGAPRYLATAVCEQIQKGVRPGFSTNQIFRAALRYLVKEDLDVAVRYNLRRGMENLGPAGFVFEQFLEIMLKAYDFKTRRNMRIKGVCVDHEVDVLAEKDGRYYFVEAKYRNDRKIKTHIDVVMYADARMMDIKKAAGLKDKDSKYKMWVITNTRFTSKAIKYAKCRDLILTGWGYPPVGNLEDLIIEKKLYPVTVLPSVSRFAREQFAKYDMLLAQDLLPYDDHILMKKFGLTKSLAKRIAREVRGLVG